MNELFVALYVYEDTAKVTVEAADVVRLFRLEPPLNASSGFQTIKDVTFKSGVLPLVNGVYGWFFDQPVKLSIEGEVIVVARPRGRGKDPWPPPPPPPPKFKAVTRWPEHASDKDAHFMAAVGVPSPIEPLPEPGSSSRTAPAPAPSKPKKTKPSTKPTPSTSPAQQVPTSQKAPSKPAPKSKPSTKPSTKPRSAR